ncbi:minor tail protein [Roseobacter phage RDJL Phi 2]|uniref:Cell wall peptidase n=1 Tax=Roseobacter phage RDJL Phi 2 TaxID=1682380 RepID=A0A0K0PVK3_9CAUD|nr:minor tail protein [Roseobacter phage RDJL Phi 2]AKQ75862.1 cell wall peptidase [Roseobacter phage RDJL Phi 2]
MRGVWRELYDTEPEAPPPYKPDWYDLLKDDLLLRKASQYLLPLNTLAEALPGDVLVFRMRQNMAAKHCGILVDEGRMVHALTGKDVEEVTVNHVYWKRCVGAFRFPEV